MGKVDVDAMEPQTADLGVSRNMKTEIIDITKQQRIALLSLAGFREYAKPNRTVARNLIKGGFIEVMARNARGEAFYRITPKGKLACQ